MSNIFAAEPLIIARIAANVTGLEDVGSVSKLAGYRPDQIPLPSVYVIPGPAEVEGDPNDGGVQIEYQTWQVVVCVGHIEDTATDDSATTAKAAGEILFQVMRALVGWRPASGFMPMAYRGREEPYYEPGYAEFPALFQTGLVITGI
jgi:hypothetical protein